MELQNFIEGFRQDLTVIVFITDDEEEVEVVGLALVLVVALGDHAHDLANALNFLDQCHFALQVHDASYDDWLKEQHLVDSQQDRLLSGALHACCDP